MERSRAARRDRVRSRRKQLAIYAVASAVALGVLAALITGIRWAEGVSRPASVRAGRAEETAALVPASRATTRTPVEVPNVTGKTLPEAELVLTAAGFVVRSTGPTTTADGSAPKVAAQSPAPGTRLAKGEQVTLDLAEGGRRRARPVVVVLDPGHQAKADPTSEPLGPGSPDRKESGTAGASGVETRRRECQVALEIALRVKTHLEAAGVQVLMTRTSNDVDLSNVQRADIANKAGADLFVRLHADGAASAKTRGVSVLYPGGNSWVAKIEAPSRRAAVAVGRALVQATGAPDGGVSQRADLAGFNWSKVPAILVETGYLSNREDDRLLANPGYQDKVAAGIVGGLMTYFGR